MPITYPTPKLVIFDCDGVLVDSETLSNQVLVDNLARHGLQLSLAECMDLFVGGTMADVRTKAIARGADLPQDWIAEIYEETYSRLRQGVDLVPGVSDLLALLQARGIAFCVASNGSEEKMRITLGQNGLWDLFHPHAMFSAHTLKTGKPDPDLFLAAACHFDVQARDCLVIEDSENGAIAAARAGMRCLGFDPHGTGHRLTPHNAEHITTITDVPRLIGLRP
ncbi:haloacid dehalogenase superfamily, subfamily IA, variant 3 with third motif protein having DD or ED [Phaeobacter piscinae]|uniref:Haloacid dehalogenase superfamily, subfamily IA, variant 3 with third motif protein having DD or ED n=1 Tax=Phaeobacter piscinae TaxID=1580596 RepID=A0ABM6PGF8_9RHOB|nr:HAD family phosphatase [Phaeobacter piscinae]ATG36823.1 haloacid dehalogenase superfamily, subfamily IA, variant 3 with third motif protein having DD or ED [Phaeobacter piscinae]AUQ87344.1 haloacid dehalogenase superfamily, subfamily IA, variant 3 with third motif protein having DD or ED [Phaeobacter piscinae]AUR25227.1 haloacid dehalogenase superfamily, subfamily IA, variant 3 with third motif protein having DD or ED [Phaeobacter piscinae]